MDRLDVMRLFVQVAETASFSKAAKANGLGQPTVSKHIAGLEKRLGAQLIRRTSRGLSLTDAGDAFYKSVVRLLDEFDEVEAQISHSHATPTGRIRVALSAGFGRMHVLPHLAAFFALYPGMSVDADVSDHHINLIENRIDVAIRIGTLSDSSLVARLIGSGETALVASPAYLARRGRPDSPADLASHDCVTFIADSGTRPWEFAGPGGSIRIEPKGPVRTSDADYLRSAVLSGYGLAQAPGWLFVEELENGGVVRLLEGFAPARHSIYAVSPSGRLQSNKVRVFVDFLADTFSRQPSLRLR